MSLAAVLHYLAGNLLEASGVVTTLVGIWLTTRRSMLSWPFVLAADILYLLVFYRARLLSDTLLQVCFLAFTLYGWWNWARGVREEGEVRVVPLPLRSVILALAAGAAGSVALGTLAQHLHASLPWLDATLTSLSLVASWWGARRHTASWWLWIAVDLAYVGEYLWKGLRMTALLYAALAGLAVLGLRDWRRAEAAAGQTAGRTTFESGSPAM